MVKVILCHSDQNTSVGEFTPPVFPESQEKFFSTPPVKTTVDDS